MTSDDSTTVHHNEIHWDRTVWIDKSDHVFRKEIEHSDTYAIVTKTIHVPFHQDTTTIYPVVEFNTQTPADTFRFTPPTDAREVTSLEPDINLPPSQPKARMVGETAPEVWFSSSGGKKIALSSYRGEPVLIDLWATWCGPCLVSMPSLNHIYNDFKSRGPTVITFDQDSVPENATEYLARHHYTWPNYHDADSKVSKAFKDDGIPLTILIDAQGKIVYYDWGGDEAALRKAILALGVNGSSKTSTAARTSSNLPVP